MAIAPTGAEVYDAANALLAEVMLCLREAGRPVPDRFYVSPGQPAYDCCDALIAEVTRVKKQTMTPGRANSGMPCAGECWVAETNLHLLRCVPGMDDSGSFPDARDLDTAAFGLHADGTALLECLACQDCDDPLCAARAVAGYDVRGPMGNCASILIKLNLPLSGRTT